MKHSDTNRPGDSGDHDHNRDHNHDHGRSVDAGDGDATIRFSVPDMDCASCAGKVENSLDRIDGVTGYETQSTTGRVVASYDRNRATESILVDAIEGAGYGVTDSNGGTTDETGGHNHSGTDGVWRSTRAKKTGVGAGFLAVGLVLEFFLDGVNPELASILGEPVFAVDVLFLSAVAVAGQSIVRNGYYSAKNLNLDIDFLMAVAILGALAASLAFGEALYFEAATLSVLFSVAWRSRNVLARSCWMPATATAFATPAIGVSASVALILAVARSCC